MRYIEKRCELVFLTNWVNANPDKLTEWCLLDSNRKKRLKKVLKNDQKSLCCYCETQLLSNYSHIEHLKPREHNPDLIYDYNNLLYSCQCNLPAGTPHQCGVSKDNYNGLFISPLDVNCDKRFKFLPNGRIVPKNNSLKEYFTIKLLNLNEPVLVDRRKKKIMAILKNDVAIIPSKVNEYLEPQNSGKFLNEFHSTIKSVFNK